MFEAPKPNWKMTFFGQDAITFLLYYKKRPPYLKRLLLRWILGICFTEILPRNKADW